jgi:hypothetical protein
MKKLLLLLASRIVPNAPDFIPANDVTLVNSKLLTLDTETGSSLGNPAITVFTFQE